MKEVENTTRNRGYSKIGTRFEETEHKNGKNTPKNLRKGGVTESGASRDNDQMVAEETGINGDVMNTETSGGACRRVKACLSTRVSDLYSEHEDDHNEKLITLVSAVELSFMWSSLLYNIDDNENSSALCEGQCEVYIRGPLSGFCFVGGLPYLRARCRPTALFPAKSQWQSWFPPSVAFTIAFSVAGCRRGLRGGLNNSVVVGFGLFHRWSTNPRRRPIAALRNSAPPLRPCSELDKIFSLISLLVICFPLGLQGSSG
ncbi:hypothetical protein PIB30_094877 [Stylosanthes scabra]|uniref:Uncharacterized protein n=1 Tax=Stylosanthes scabra TaxID=79078 RepID=A0ABU6VXA9_9FABA|nr:hypothetical protein [Stylosanthes scabra]